MTLLKWKIAVINIMLALITIVVLLLIAYLVFNDDHEMPIAVSLIGLVASLIGGFFYELKLLHKKDKDIPKGPQGCNPGHPGKIGKGK